MTKKRALFVPEFIFEFQLISKAVVSDPAVCTDLECEAKRCFVLSRTLFNYGRTLSIDILGIDGPSV